MYTCAFIFTVCYSSVVCGEDLEGSRNGGGMEREGREEHRREIRQ